MCIFKKLRVQDFKNHLGDKLKPPEWESPAGIGKVGMSD